MNRIETILTLYDDESVHEKLKVMNKGEALFDDGRNFEDDFLDRLEEFLEVGHKYKFIIEKI